MEINIPIPSFSVPTWILLFYAAGVVASFFITAVLVRKEVIDNYGEMAPVHILFWPFALFYVVILKPIIALWRHIANWNNWN